jgi:hypothetical protein
MLTPCFTSLSTNKRKTTINCEQTNAPPGYIILESMRMLYGKFDSYYWGLYNAHQMMDPEIDTFTDKFSPLIDPMKDEKIALDIIGMLFAVVNVSAFNTCTCLHSFGPSQEADVIKS